MGVVGSLFEEPYSIDRRKLAARLAELAARHIFVGGSSWKYEGWLGQIYTRSRYLTRGRFSRKLFEATCIREYAEVFPIVCGDFSFYQFPPDEFWRNLFAQTPPNFRFAFKVPQQITAVNPDFLDAEMLKQMFLRPLEPYREQTSLLIFEFSAFSPGSLAGLGEFLDRLDPFLAQLPPEFRYSVEVRNPEFLQPEYFACLRNHRVAHVYNAWSRMPELGEQIRIPDSVTADFIVSRALLRHGRPYERAVKLFQPYTDIKDPNPRARDALCVLIERSREAGRMAFLFVNNRLEGNAPLTILSIVD